MPHLGRQTTNVVCVCQAGKDGRLKEAQLELEQAGRAQVVTLQMWPMMIYAGCYSVVIILLYPSCFADR